MCSLEYYENLYCFINNQTIASLYLTTQDTSYISQTIIDGAQSGSVITYNCSTQDSLTLLAGFTIQNGYNPDGGGGGINLVQTYFTNPRPILENLVIKDNFATIGGGIKIYGGNEGLVKIRDVIIKNNSAINGGGLSIFGDAVIENVKITNNIASENGGGIYGIGSQFSLDNVFINNNESDGFYNEGGGTIIINNTVISNNTGTGFRNTPYWNSNNIEITNSIVSNNLNGGVWLFSENAILENVVIHNNSTNDTGGGLKILGDNYEATTIIINCTVISNTAYQGGGIYCRNNNSSISKALLVNNIIFGNAPEQIYLYDSNSSYPTFVSVYYNDIENGETGIAPASQVYWGEGNIQSNPCFVDLGEGYPYLQDQSFCIGAGIGELEIPIGPFINTGTYYAPEHDLEGNPRPDPEGSMPDMGACENLLGEPLVDVNNDQFPAFILNASNIPNPFNPSTTINYSLPNDSSVNISIYNMKGQLVKQLLDESRLAGTHSVFWNGKNMNSSTTSGGVYLYLVQTSEKTISRKMVLLK